MSITTQYEHFLMRFRESLMEGIGYKPDDQLRISVLSEQYGESTSTITRGLQSLIREGLVQKNGRRYYIDPIRPEEIQQLQRMKTNLEILAHEKGLQSVSDDKLEELIKLEVVRFKRNDRFRQLHIKNRKNYFSVLLGNSGHIYLVDDIIWLYERASRHHSNLRWLLEEHDEAAAGIIRDITVNAMVSALRSRNIDEIKTMLWSRCEKIITTYLTLADVGLR